MSVSGGEFIGRSGAIAAVVAGGLALSRGSEALAKAPPHELSPSHLHSQEAEQTPFTQETWRYGFGPIDKPDSIVAIPSQNPNEPFVVATGELDWVPTSDLHIPFDFENRGLAISQGFNGEPHLVTKKNSKDIISARLLDAVVMGNGNRLLLLDSFTVLERLPDTDVATKTGNETTLYSVSPDGEMSEIEMNGGPLQFAGPVQVSFSENHHMIHGYRNEIDTQGRERTRLLWVDVSEPSNPRILKSIAGNDGSIIPSSDGSVLLFNGQVLRHVHGPDSLSYRFGEMSVQVPQSLQINGKAQRLVYPNLPGEKPVEVSPGVYAIYAMTSSDDRTPLKNPHMALFDLRGKTSDGSVPTRFIPTKSGSSIATPDGRLLSLCQDRVLVFDGKGFRDIFPRATARREPQSDFSHSPFAFRGLFSTGRSDQVGYVSSYAKEINGVPRSSWAVVDFSDTTALPWAQNFIPSTVRNNP